MQGHILTYTRIRQGEKKSETRKTARVLKQDPNTEKIKKNAYLI